jgi:hypothetical protein
MEEEPMRVSYVVAVAIGLVCVGVVACSEELNPATVRQPTRDSGVDDEGGSVESGAFAGHSCSSILECVEGCRTTQCQTDCTKGASPRAQGIIQEWQACLDAARAASSCAPYCTASDAGAGDAGAGATDGGDAGAVTGPQSPLCTLCALTVCRAHLDACVADK